MNFKPHYFRMSHEIPKGGFDMTPMIDVVFQLIIFFLLSSSFVLQPGIKVDLPTANKFGDEKQTEFSLVIRKDGSLYYHDRKIAMKQLPELLRKEGILHPGMPLILKADENALHGTVTRVMGLAKEAEIEKLAIATRPGFSEETES